jgi:hypothetical protein
MDLFHNEIISFYLRKATIKPASDESIYVLSSLYVMFFQV